MAVYITGDGLKAYYTPSSTSSFWLYTSNMYSTISVRFDGAGSSRPDALFEYYDYISITKKNVSTTYKTTSTSVTLKPDDFNYKKSSESGSVSLTFDIGQYGNMLADNKLILGDVYLNGAKISTCDNYYALIFIYPDAVAFNPTISMSDISIQSTSWNGLAVAGETILKVDNITFGNATSYDPNNSYSLSVSTYGTSSVSAVTTRVNNTTAKITDIATNTSDNTAYNLTVSASVENRYGSTKTITKTITIYPYHLPRLKLNTTGDVSYVSRCQEDGTADGLGTHGHLHLVWDVCPINTTGSGTINTLQSATVILNNTTPLQPKGGSISAGYLDYIFPLATETQGNLTITLTDTRKSNTITALNVPKGSMPLSLYDDNSGIGVAFGCMATTSGMWVYMPMYLQSTSGSSMWRIKVDDSGNLSTEKV